MQIIKNAYLENDFCFKVKIKKSTASFLTFAIQPILQKDYLENYKNSDGIFIFMGYDSVNDVYVLWNPSKQRSRINLRKSVSLFCELDVLEKVKTFICLENLLDQLIGHIFTRENQTIIQTEIFFQI